MKRLLVLLLLIAPFASAATRDNDDSCDISVLPAATLLLPYFRIDLDDRDKQPAFSITNVTNVDQIAHVTLWTERAVPVLDFNIYLTGYDVQAIGLYDVIGRGLVAPDAGTGTNVHSSKRRVPTSDPNPALDLSACGFLPGALDLATVSRVQRAFAEESIDPACGFASRGDRIIVGYATIDVVGSCTAAGSTDPNYFTRDIRYDNVLTGYAYFVENDQNYTRRHAYDGAPLVHIRAVPEGGTPAVRRAGGFVWDAGFERTFYGRYQPADAPRLDARQPLPSQFAARWIAGPRADTQLQIWRESASDTCAAATSAVVFDENENAVSVAAPVRLPATSSTSIEDEPWPQLPNGANAGWISLGLDAQNWVASAMRADGFRTTLEAAALGNGCTRADNVEPRAGVASTGNDDSCDIAVMPAATLLLPYFEVDIKSANGERTLFTVTNVSARDRIARVTLWTDLGYPVITFNLALGPYDVQSVSLYDVIARGLWPATACSPNGSIPSEYVARMQSAFTIGRVADFGEEEGCPDVGLFHALAVGYATIDVVSNCNTHNPSELPYWTADIAFDNVLIGDTMQINGRDHQAQATPLVHIRAIPDGGTLAERSVHPSRWDAGFPRTFYARFQQPGLPRLDARQPLPSAFAAPWTSQGVTTSFKIWREGPARRTATCLKWDEALTRVADLIRFDEQENPVGAVPCRVCPEVDFELPMTSRTESADWSIYPQLTNGAITGWMYFNLDDDKLHQRGSQNWVTVSMRSPLDPAAIEIPATAFGNGCSAPARDSEITTGVAIIGPLQNR